MRPTAVPLTDSKLLDQLAKLPEEGDVKVEGVQGTVLRRIITSAGTILVGGRGRNIYELDKLSDVSRGDRSGRRR